MALCTARRLFPLVGRAIAKPRARERPLATRTVLRTTGVARKRKSAEVKKLSSPLPALQQTFIPPLLTAAKQHAPRPLPPKTTVLTVISIHLLSPSAKDLAYPSEVSDWGGPHRSLAGAARRSTGKATAPILFAWALMHAKDMISVGSRLIERFPKYHTLIPENPYARSMYSICTDYAPRISRNIRALTRFNPPLASHGAYTLRNTMTHTLPPTRGTLTPNRPLADLTWLRVGGPADWVFQPADEADLAAFLAALPPQMPVFPMGVGSNLIVRDGGLRAVVIRLGRGFNSIEIQGDRVVAGAAALDAHVARKAAEAGRDLTFLRTIPGSIGGAVCMNAGCYGHYVADVLEDIRVVTRAGHVQTIPAADLNLRYRQSDLPEGCVVIGATFRAPQGNPSDLNAKMDDQIARRDASQPTKERSAGSTFRNPVGHSSTGRADDSHELKAWKVIDDAGMRGATLGGAQMSPMHSNFLINSGGATAADLENLGEEVRKRVFQNSGITLEWEIMRVGEPAAK